MRSLLTLVCDSAGLLHTLLAVERPKTWQRAAIVREWQRLRSTAHEFNHCEGYEHDRWWNRVRRFDASDETNEQDRIGRFADVGPRSEAGHQGMSGRSRPSHLGAARTSRRGAAQGRAVLLGGQTGTPALSRTAAVSSSGSAGLAPALEAGSGT